MPLLEMETTADQLDLLAVFYGCFVTELSYARDPSSVMFYLNLENWNKVVGLIQEEVIQWNEAPTVEENQFQNFKAQGIVQILDFAYRNESELWGDNGPNITKKMAGNILLSYEMADRKLN